MKRTATIITTIGVTLLSAIAIITSSLGGDQAPDCIPDVAVNFEPTMGGWTDEYGHLVYAAEHEDDGVFCDPRRN